MDAAGVAWSNNSQTLYGLRDSEGGWSLVAADVNRGAVRTVADYRFELVPTPLNFRLSPSPDGKSLAVGTVKRQTDLWILDGFTH